MYEHEPGRVPSQSPLLLVNMALGASTTPQLTSLKGKDSGTLGQKDSVSIS